MLNSSLYLLHRKHRKPSEGLPAKPGRSNIRTAPQHPHACSRKVPSSERARTCQSHPPPMQAQEPSGQKGGRSHRRSMHAPGPNHLPIQILGVSPVPNRGLQASSPWASDPFGHRTPSEHHRSSMCILHPWRHPSRRIVQKSCPVCSRARCPSSRSRSDQKEKLETI